MHHLACILSLEERNPNGCFFQMSPRYIVFIWDHLNCVCVYVCASTCILTQLSTVPHGSFSSLVRQLRIPSGTRMDVEMANIHGMCHYRKLPMVPNSGPGTSQSYRVVARDPWVTRSIIIHCVKNTESISQQRMCVPVMYCATNHPQKHRGLKQKLFSHNFLGWLVVPFHVVSTGVPRWLQSSGDLIGLEHPRWLT